MTTSMPVKTARELRNAITSEMVIQAHKVFMHKAQVETIRPIVRKYQDEILVRNQFHPAKEWLDRGFKDRALDKKDDYLMSDEDAERYYSELHEEHLKHGFEVPEKGYCPLLMAEDQERRAIRALLVMFEPVTGIKVDDILGKLEHYREYTDIVLKMMATYISE
jgi:hypothetical protein